MSLHEKQYLEAEGTIRTFLIIQSIVANNYGKQDYELQTDTRLREYCEPRQVVHLIGHKWLGIPCNKIDIAGRKHCDVLHSCKVCRNLYQSDKHFRARLDRISEQIGMTSEALKELMNPKPKFPCR